MIRTGPSLQPNGLYERDFYSWTQEQSKAIAEHRWADVDAENVAEEIRSLGFRLEREIRDRLEILISYLLKWRHLAEYRGLAWKENIDRQRREVTALFAENSGLVPRKDEFLVSAYEAARGRLKYETYFFESDFPASSPFTPSQVMDAGYFPEELDAPATGQFPNAQSIGR